jgi:hypothetical protein
MLAGATLARFSNAVKAALFDPTSMLLHLPHARAARPWRRARPGGPRVPFGPLSAVHALCHPPAPPSPVRRPLCGSRPPAPRLHAKRRLFKATVHGARARACFSTCTAAARAAAREPWLTRRLSPLLGQPPCTKRAPRLRVSRGLSRCPLSPPPLPPSLPLSPVAREPWPCTPPGGLPRCGARCSDERRRRLLPPPLPGSDGFRGALSGQRALSSISAFSGERDSDQHAPLVLSPPVRGPPYRTQPTSPESPPAPVTPPPPSPMRR